jgi:hypothetical protein
VNKGLETGIRPRRHAAIMSDDLVAGGRQHAGNMAAHEAARTGYEKPHFTLSSF